MNDNIAKIREIQLVAAAFLQLIPELKISQVNSPIVDFFGEQQIDGSRFAVMACPSLRIDEENINKLCDIVKAHIADLNGCPLYLSHYEPQQGLMIDWCVLWDYDQNRFNTTPQLKMLADQGLKDFRHEVSRQGHQIRILKENYQMVVKKISFNADRHHIQCNAEMIYLRDFTPQYKMNPKPVENSMERFYRNLNGQPQDDYPQDLLDIKILEAVQKVYPEAKVENCLMVTSTEYRSFLKYRNYQSDYAEFRFLPDISQIPYDVLPRLGKIEGARLCVDILMLLRSNKNAFANEGFELSFPLEGWFETLSKLVEQMKTLHRVNEILR